MYLGFNAAIVEIDASNHVMYVTDLGNDKSFGDRYAIDCNEAIGNIIFAMSTMMLKIC